MEDTVTGHISLDDDEEEKRKRNATTNHDAKYIVAPSNTTTMLSNVTAAMLAPNPVAIEHAPLVPANDEKPTSLTEMLNLKNTTVIQIEVARKSGANIENKILANQITLQENHSEKSQISSNDTVVAMPTIQNGTNRDISNLSADGNSSDVANVTTSSVNSTWNKGNRSEEVLDGNGAKNKSEIISENKRKQALNFSNITSSLDSNNLLSNQSQGTNNLLRNQSLGSNNLLTNQSNLINQPVNSSVQYIRSMKFGTASKDAMLSAVEKRDGIKQGKRGM